MASSPHVAHLRYRADVDGLRAVAVLAVVVFHAFPSRMPGGFVGVDVFFVISGFLISSIILSGLRQGRFSLLEFYARRIRRIFPALLLVLAACFAFGWVALFADEYGPLGKHMAGGAGFISNILLWRESGYFDTAAEVKPLLHLWSLGIEEQFYIVWPLVLWAAWRLRVNVGVVAAVLAAASFGWCLYMTRMDAESAFYLPLPRAWELLIGAILAYVMLERAPSAPRRWQQVSSALGIVLLGVGFYFTNRGRAFPGFWALLPTLGAALTIAAGPEAWLNRYLLSLRPLVWIGLISFPLYLWHWPLLSFARIVTSATPPASVRAAAVLLAALLATLSYFAIERPVRRSRSRFTVAALAGAVAVAGLVGYLTTARAGLPERAAARSAAAFRDQFVGTEWVFTSNELCTKRYPYDSRNHKWFFCITNRDAPPSLLLLGDSYANHLYPGMVQDPRLGKNTILSFGACTVDLGREGDEPDRTSRSPCTGLRPHKQRRFIEDLVKASVTLRYVIFDGLREQVDDDYLMRVEERVAFFEGQHVQVILFVPHIRADIDLKRCFARPFKNVAAECTLPLSVRAKIDAGFAPLQRKIAAAHPQAKFFDQNQAFCDAEKCSLVVDGMPIYRDSGSHYSPYASALVAHAFGLWAQRELPGLL